MGDAREVVFSFVSWRAMGVMLVAMIVSFAGMASALAEEEAKPDMAKVLQFVRAGNQAFEAEDYETALENYEQAHALFSNPTITHRLAQTTGFLGRNRESVKYYEEFLEQQPEGENADRVRALLPGLRATLPALVTIASAPQGANVFRGDERGDALGKTPLETEFEAGEVTISLVFPGHDTLTKTLTLAPGEELALNLELVETPPEVEVPVATRPDDPPRRRLEDLPETRPLEKEDGMTLSTWGWTTLGVGGAVLATGGIFSLFQVSTTNDVNNYNKREAGASVSHLEGLKDDARAYHKTAQISYITGGVIAAVGAGILTYDMLTSDSDTQAAASSWQLQMGVGWLGLNGQF